MKRFGVAAFSEYKEQYDNANDLLKRQDKELKDQLQIFQERLISFSREHNKELRDNPEFRIKFTKMCSSIGIDSLSLFDKDKHLFDVNDFYYQICVKVIEICRSTKNLNGGIISFNELHQSYFKSMNINMDDIEKAVDMLESLDGGFERLSIGRKIFLRSVPNELTNDQTKILDICSILGYASLSLLKANLKWEAVRSKTVLNEMVANGLLWVDDQSDLDDETLYWAPSWVIG